MKTCSKCYITKPSSQFYLRKTGPRAGQYYEICKECFKMRGRKYYHENRDRQLPLALIRKNKARHRLYEIVNEKKKGVPCLDCGGTFPEYVMDFDHRDPTSKINSIAQAGSKGLYTEKQLLKEIEKCDLVCTNCHRVRTYLQTHSKINT